MVNGSRFYRALESVSMHQLYLALLPFTHARSESLNADSLKLQLGEWWAATADSNCLPQAVTCQL